MYRDTALVTIQAPRGIWGTFCVRMRVTVAVKHIKEYSLSAGLCSKVTFIVSRDALDFQLIKQGAICLPLHNECSLIGIVACHLYLFYGLAQWRYLQLPKCGTICLCTLNRALLCLFKIGLWHRLFYFINCIFLKLCSFCTMYSTLVHCGFFSMLYKQSWYDIAVSKITNNEYIHWLMILKNKS